MYPQISVIIPTLDEAENLVKLIPYLYEYGSEYIEIIVVDGGSTDDTVQVAEQAGVKVVLSPTQGRAVQMNYGAKHARGDIFYFVHADTIPAKSFTQDILTTL